MKRNIEPSVRLHCILVRESRSAVVFRRGPTNLVQLLLWDLQRDSFVGGQWFKGRIYERRCDLSPSGRYLIYFAATHRGPYATWTAVSQPPYLTALALWPKGDAWGGGGLFASERSIALNHRDTEMALADNFYKPKSIKVSSMDPRAGWGEDSPIYDIRMKRDGWELTREGRHIEGSFDDEIWITYEPTQVWSRSWKRKGIILEVHLIGIHKKNGPWYVQTIHHKDPHSQTEIEGCDWADIDKNGDLLYAKGGALYRKVYESSHSTQLIDLSNSEFTEMKAPEEARRW